MRIFRIRESIKTLFNILPSKVPNARHHLQIPHRPVFLYNEPQLFFMVLWEMCPAHLP